MADLKLIALEAADLPIISAHLQDAVMRVADLAWLPREKRFVLAANRFDWDTASKTQNRNERHRAILRFEHVRSARIQGLDLAAKDTVLSLLAIQFEESDPPGGNVTLIFAGDGAINLDVECIEAELRDLGETWKARSRPSHSITDRPDNDEQETDGDASFNSDT